MTTKPISSICFPTARRNDLCGPVERLHKPYRLLGVRRRLLYAISSVLIVPVRGGVGGALTDLRDPSISMGCFDFDRILVSCKSEINGFMSENIPIEITVLDDKEVCFEEIDVCMHQQTNGLLPMIRGFRCLLGSSSQNLFDLNAVPLSEVSRDVYHCMFLELDNVVDWKNVELQSFGYSDLSVDNKNYLFQLSLLFLANCNPKTIQINLHQLVIESLQYPLCLDLDFLVNTPFEKEIMGVKSVIVSIVVPLYIYLHRKVAECHENTVEKMIELKADASTLKKIVDSEDTVRSEFDEWKTLNHKWILMIIPPLGALYAWVRGINALEPLFGNFRELTDSPKPNPINGWIHHPTVGVFSSIHTISHEQLLQLNKTAQPGLEAITNYFESIRGGIENGQANFPIDANIWNVMAIPAGIMDSSKIESQVQWLIDFSNWLCWVNAIDQTSMRNNTLSRDQFIDPSNVKRSFSEVKHFPELSVKSLLALEFPNIPFPEAVHRAAETVNEPVSDDAMRAMIRLAELNDEIAERTLNEKGINQQV